METQNPLHRSRFGGLPHGLACLFAILLCLLAGTVFAKPPQTIISKPVYDITAPNPIIERFLNAEFHDDLDSMLNRGMIRVAVTYSKTHYFIDQGKQYGVTSETLQAFEAYLRKRYKSRLKGRSLAVVFIPVPRNQLFTMLESGRAELAVANLTVSENRKKRADFTIPLRKNVSEVVISGAHVNAPRSLLGLSGKRVVLRKSSTFYQHMLELNVQLQARGRQPVIIVEADEYLESEDLLEMLNAGLIDYTVTDGFIARLWAKVFPNIRINKGMVLKKDRSIAWAVRKGSPALLAEANLFLKHHKAGTRFGNIVRQRYLEDPYWAKRALDQSEIAKFNELVQLFRKYADEYEFDYLMLMAQGYQESQLDHSRRSPVGAIGIMQIMPKTGRALGVGDIRLLEPNVHAGTKYMRNIINLYFSEPAINPVNRTLFAFAAYNCGPNRIQRLRKKTAAAGLNPNIWFGNVEYTVARYVGREPVRYVSNIAKYYVAYKMIQQQMQEKNERKNSIALR